MKRLVSFVVLAGLFLFSSVVSAGCWGEFGEYVTNNNGNNKLLIEFNVDCDIDSTPTLVQISLNSQLIGNITPEKQKVFGNTNTALWPKFFVTQGYVEILEKLQSPGNLEVSFLGRGKKEISDPAIHQIITYDAIIAPMAYDCWGNTGYVRAWYSVMPMYGFDFQAVPSVSIYIGGKIQKVIVPACSGEFCWLTVDFTTAEYELIKGKWMKNNYTFLGGTAKSSYDHYDSCIPYEGD